MQRAPSVGADFATISYDTGSSNTFYNDTGLVVNTFYNYRANCFNATHYSPVSNTYSQTTFHLSDAVDDLIAAASESIVGILLSWSQPDTLYGYLEGYMINYTTPLGDPTTIYTNLSLIHI